MSDLSFVVLLNLQALTSLINWAILALHGILYLLIATEVALGMVPNRKLAEEAQLSPCDWSWAGEAAVRQLPSNLLRKGVLIPLPGQSCVYCDDDPWEGFVPSEENSISVAEARVLGWPYDETTLETLVEANFNAFKRQLQASPTPKLFLTRDEWKGCGRRTLFIKGQKGRLEFTPFKALVQEEQDLLWKVFETLDENDPTMGYFDLDMVEVPSEALAKEASVMIQAKIPFPDYGDCDLGEVGLPEIEAV
jgi:hypothetical protein